MLSIYSTLTREQRPFESLEPGRVRMYVCGVTVYDYCHIGHGRTFVAFDVVRRWLEASGYKVTFVRNITDVDDKIIRRAAERGVTTDELTDEFARAMQEDMLALGCLAPTFEPRATQYIPQMLNLIGKLEEKGFAYHAADGDVDYAVRKFPNYGRLSGKSIDDLQSGARVQEREGKHDPLDFVLWKSAKPGEPQWDSKWGCGRPGWHIECSVMSKKYLGEQIDIHAGGEDLVFPHHENEIAQSEACNGKEFAKYWMHNAFLNIDNHKMSKSLGNFRTVREISEQYDLQILRFFMLSAHYRSPLNFSAELMEASKNGLERIQNAADNLRYMMEQAKEESMTDAEKDNLAKTKEFVTAFETAMEDDFNTADAIAAIFDLVKYANTTATAEGSREYAKALYDLLVKLTDVLGIIVDKKEKILEDEIEAWIAERQPAKKENRDELAAKGIVLLDTREGVKWKKA